MINQVTLVGRLTKDPDLRITPDGVSVVNVTLAVNRQFKNQNGDYEADFVQCTLWRKIAENTANYCRKGAILGLTGKIHTRNYTNQEGKRVYITEVVAESVQFLSRKPVAENRTERVGNTITKNNATNEWIMPPTDWPPPTERPATDSWVQKEDLDARATAGIS